MKKCPSCGAKFSDEVVFCTNCGTSLQPDDAPKTEEKICPKCGARLPHDMLFCTNCGTALSENPEETPPAEEIPPVEEVPPVEEIPTAMPEVESASAVPPKKVRKFGKKTLLAIAGIAIVAVVILIVSLVSVGGKSYLVPTNSLMLAAASDEEWALLYGETVYKDVLDNADYFSTTKSLDGTILLAWAYASVDEDSTSLSLLTKDGEKTIDSNLKNNALDCSYAISSDNSAISYVTTDGNLILYDVNTAEKTTICREDALYAVISPDGKQVLYNTHVESEDGYEYVLYWYDGKTSTKLGEGYIPLSISNGGKCIYAYHTERRALYAFDQSGEREKISDMDYYYDGYYVSKDSTEILFFSDSKTYISANGGEKEKLASTYLYPLSTISLGPGIYSHGCNSSLFDQLYADSYSYSYYSSCGYYYISSDHTAEKIASSVESFATTEDYSTIYYVKNGSLYYATSKDSYEPVDVETKDDVAYVYMSDDGNRVYYLTEDDDLYYLKSNGSSEKVTSDVETVTGFYNGRLYYMTDEDEMCYASKASKTKVDDDVTRCLISGTAVYYITDDGDLYGSENGKDFTRLLRDLET